MDRSLRGALVAEFIGTFLFVTIGAGAIVTTTYQGADNAGLVGIALAHALALGVMVSAFGAISGGHLNPAVTIGILTAGKIKAAPATMYIVVQLVAAAAAALFLRFVFPEAIWQPSHLGMPGLGADITPTLGIAIEFVMTLVLIIVVFGTAVDARGPKLGGLAIGLALGASILFAGPLTSAMLNPARWFGPAIVSGYLDDWYVWIVGPVLAGIAVGALWRFVLAEQKAPTEISEA
jgi:MIP family channel proteins